MTFKEKLKMEHPEYVDDGYKGGCVSCPNDYGYEIVDDSVKNCLSSGGKGCNYCWNREIPEVKNGEHIRMDNFSKSDLKDGMVVEYRNGEKALFIVDLFITTGGSSSLDELSDNLTSSTNKDNIDDDFDIMKVYTINRHNKYPSIYTLLDGINNQYLDLIWERKELKEETKDNISEEKLTCEELYEKIKQYCNSLQECDDCYIQDLGCYCKSTPKRRLKELWNHIQACIVENKEENK